MSTGTEWSKIQIGKNLFAQLCTKLCSYEIVVNSKFYNLALNQKMEPRKLLSRLRRRIGRLEVLAGSNANEGTKALMYFSPYLFPNREVERAALSRHDFSSTVDRIFAHLSKQVRNLLGKASGRGLGGWVDFVFGCSTARFCWGR